PIPLLIPQLAPVINALCPSICISSIYARLAKMSSVALIYWQEVIVAAIPTDHLADNIKVIREARGLSQQQIAKAAGIPRATWTHLESGAANPTLAVLIKVANALQIRVDELLAAPRAPARHLRSEEHTSELQSPDHL